MKIVHSLTCGPLLQINITSETRAHPKTNVTGTVTVQCSSISRAIPEIPWDYTQPELRPIKEDVSSGLTLLTGIGRVFLWAETVDLDCVRDRQAKPRMGGTSPRRTLGTYVGAEVFDVHLLIDEMSEEVSSVPDEG